MVDDLALLVHHVVVLEQMLADIEVVRFDLLLGILDRPRNPSMLDRNAVLHADTVHQALETVSAEDSEQIVLEREIKTRRAGVALAARTPAQLVIDSPRLVALGAAAGHVGRDSYRLVTPRLRDDLGLAFVVLRVEDVMLDPGFLKLVRNALRLFDRYRADQHRLATLATVLDLLDYRVELFRLGLVDHVVIVFADHRHVGGNHGDVEVVDFPELDRLGICSTGHAGKLLVHAEVILEGDRRERLVFGFDLDAFLGFDRLVQPVAPAPPRHQAAGELVDDNHLAFLDHVVDVELEERVRLQPLVDMMDERDVARVIEVLDSEQLFDAGAALFRERDRAQLLIDRVVLLGLEPRDHAVHDVIRIGRFLGSARDNQRRASLIDQDRIDFVDDREVVLALDVILQAELHVVAQVVEPEFVVLAVGDVAVVRLLALRVGKSMNDAADAQAEEIVDSPHPLGIAPGEIVVDCNHMDAASAKRVERRRQRRDESLALARLHLGDLALMENHPADQLHVEMALAESALGGLAHDGEDFGQDLPQGILAFIDVLDRADPGFPFGDPAAQPVVGLLGDLFLEAVDLFNERRHALQFAIVLGTEDLVRHRCES